MTSIADVHICNCMGRTLKYITTDSGNYLYFQKVSKSPQQWVKEIRSRLVKAKCTDVNELLSRYCTSKYYFNKHYYKPVPHMCQMIFELGC